MRTPEETRRLRLLSQTINDEWTAWTFTLPNGRESYANHAFPHPSEEGGLPAGWAVVGTRSWSQHGPQAEGTFDFCVAHRGAGGWVVVRYELDRGEGYSRLVWLDLSLDTMYDDVSETVAEDGSDRKRMEEVQQTVASVLAGLFDDSDPREAAEKTLFALSGSLTYVPDAVRS